MRRYVPEVLSRQLGLKGLLGRSRLVPVPQPDAGAVHPDFADAVFGHLPVLDRIDDQHLFVRRDPSATDQLAGVLVVLGDRYDAVLVQGLAHERADHGRLALLAAGDDQRRFGHAVTGIQGLAAKADGREFLGKSVQRRRSNRLGAVERDVPGAQVQPLHFFVGDLLRAQIVGKVRPAADGHPVAGDGPQPANRLLQKCQRRHEHAIAAEEHRVQHPADQAHVVVGRQPEGTARLTAGLETVRDQRHVVHQIAVRQHDALRRAGGA